MSHELVSNTCICVVWKEVLGTHSGAGTTCTFHFFSRCTNALSDATLVFTSYHSLLGLVFSIMFSIFLPNSHSHNLAF